MNNKNVRYKKKPSSTRSSHSTASLSSSSACFLSHNISRNRVKSESRTSSATSHHKSERKEKKELSRSRKRDSRTSRKSPTEAYISSTSIAVSAIGPESQERPFSNEIIRLLDYEQIAQYAGTDLDPERFLRPTSNPEVNLLDRQVNPYKIFDYFTTYMDEYYNLNRDQDFLTEWRERLDEKLWDNFSFVIPLLCKQVINDAFRHEPIVVTLMPDVMVFGDIHGNLNDIHHIYKRFISDKKYSSYKFVFLGDYVDRGPKSIEVVIFLLACKLIEPKRYILLRGNHEVSKVNTKYGFRCLVEHIYSHTFRNQPDMITFIYDSFNRAFNYLPLAAVLRYKDGQKGIFFCHGGIPNEIYKPDKKPWRIGELNMLSQQFKPHNLVPKKNSTLGQNALNELLWNDPIPKTVLKKKDRFTKYFYTNTKRGGHCSYYTEEAVTRFLEANNLKLIIRGHQYRNCKDKGYNYAFNNQVLTVFSSSNYCGSQYNTTGCVLINDDIVKPLTLRTIEESKFYLKFNTFELIYDNAKKVTAVVF